MAVHKLITQPGIYFTTFTCYKWMHLIKITNAYDLVYKFFDALVSAGHAINGFVIMPNHVHLIMHYAGGRLSLNTSLGTGKRFIAYEIVNRLKALGKVEILEILHEAVQPKDRSRGKKHEVWMDAFDIKECRTEKFLLQKLNYIHNNPCTKYWNLATEPHLYRHSSALQYMNGKISMYRVKDYLEFIGMYFHSE